MAKQITEAGLAPGDPTHLFGWPWPRVVAVYLMPLLSKKRDLSDPAEFRRWRNEQRAKKGLPLIPE